MRLYFLNETILFSGCFDLIVVDFLDGVS